MLVKDYKMSRKLCVDGIEPELYLRFKMNLLLRGLSIREVIIDYLEAFVESAEAEKIQGL